MRNNMSRREYAVDLEIRSDGSGRTVHGIVVPFGVAANVTDDGRRFYDEMFQPGAFTKTLKEQRVRVPLLSQHSAHKPIGRAEDMREDKAGLYGAFRIANTTEGNDQLELVREGVLDSFSVGFNPVKHINGDGDVVVRTEVALREVSLVTFPAYAGAMVAGIRAADVAVAIREFPPEERATLIRILAATPVMEPEQLGTPDLGAVADEPTDGHSTRYTPDEIRTLIRLRIAMRGATTP